jgi:SAM-dependent methyltransferase
MAPYTPIADEYYDAARHPTCANFAQLSRSFLMPRLQRLFQTTRSVVEVGVGRSVIAPFMVRCRMKPALWALLDVSPAMLSHSRQWSDRGANLVVADARRTGLAPESCDLLVASLGDPYNTPDFWREVARVLKHGGRCLFTAPAAEWSKRFRSEGRSQEAEFVLRSGATVSVPSFVQELPDQVRLIEGSGLAVEEFSDYSSGEIEPPISQKLLVGGNRLVVLRGFAVRKPERQ